MTKVLIFVTDVSKSAILILDYLFCLVCSMFYVYSKWYYVALNL